MKRLFFIIFAVVILGGAAFWWFTRDKNGELTYRTDVISRGDILVAISATGTLNAVTTVQVGSQVSGTIAKLYADFNSQVTEGQLLAQLDPTFLQASVNEQRANYDRAQAQVNDAQRTYGRTNELFSRGLVSQADMDAATTALETAKASARQSKAALDRAEVNLKYATIRAPISGVVISRDVDVGQTVAASLQAPTIFTIAEDLSRMQVEASIDEADIGNVRQGQRVTFRVDSYPEDEFEGTVSQIRLAPVVEQNVVTYNVIIDVANPEQKLMPGMTATVSVEVARKDDVLLVPLQALRFTPQGINPQEALRQARADRSDSARPAEQRPSAEQGRRRQRSGDQHPGVQAAPTEGGDTLRLNRGGEMRDSTRAANRGVVWVLENGAPRPVPIVRGLQNTRVAELVRAPLQEGDTVIVGTTGGTTQQTAPQGQNPFMPRMPGGSGRGRR